jgi:hypothetical protein
MSPVSQTTKLLASGAATRWQGYVAREGFGSTRMRNQISANNPKMGNSQINHGLLILAQGYLPVLRQTEQTCLPFLDTISLTP